MKNSLLSLILLSGFSFNCDVLGNCLLKKNCTETSPQFDLSSSQSKGIYFVEVMAKGEKTVKKL